MRYTVFAILFLFCVFSCKSNLARKTSDEHCLYEQLKFATCKWSICDSANGRFIMLSCSYPTKGPRELKDSVSTWLCKIFGDDSCQDKDNIPEMFKINGKSILNTCNNEKIEFS